MKTRIIVNLEVEGIHRWKDAKTRLPEVAYLANYHRHLFKIQVVMGVEDLDREIEFIDFKHSVEWHVKETWGEELGLVMFGDSSCEMIATEILNHFGAKKVIVMEDGENGAEVER